MGMLVDGQWRDENRLRTNEKGEFIRAESPFRDWIGGASNRFPAESGRYHLFVNAGCPWAYRTVLYRALKNLEDVVGLSFTQPAMGSNLLETLQADDQTHD